MSEKQKSVAEGLADRFTHACAFGDFSEMQRLLAAGASVNEPCSRASKTPGMVYAAQNGETERGLATMEWLASRGGDVDAPRGDGVTALMLAAASGDEGMERAALLLRLGANANRANSVGKTALHFAARELSEAMVGLLLRAGANPLARSHAGETPASMVLPEGLAWEGRGLLLAAEESARLQIELESDQGAASKPAARFL